MVVKHAKSLMDLNIPGYRVVTQDASFTRRAGSFIIDLLILDFFVLSGFATAFRGVAFGSVTSSLYAVIVAAALLALAYFALFEYTLGQTPGMMLFRLRAEGVTLWRAFVRHAYFIPVAPLPILLLVEPIYLVWRKTRLLEQLSGTRTVTEVVV